MKSLIIMNQISKVIFFFKSTKNNLNKLISIASAMSQVRPNFFRSKKNKVKATLGLLMK